MTFLCCTIRVIYEKFLFLKIELGGSWPLCTVWVHRDSYGMFTSSFVTFCAHIHKEVINITKILSLVKKIYVIILSMTVLTLFCWGGQPVCTYMTFLG